MLDGMSNSIQRSRIENLHSREVDRQSPTGLIFDDTFTVRLSNELETKLVLNLPSPTNLLLQSVHCLAKIEFCTLQAHSGPRHVMEFEFEFEFDGFRCFS